jgi:outer membrane protein assembly factor BamA
MRYIPRLACLLVLIAAHGKKVCGQLLSDDRSVIISTQANESAPDSSGQFVIRNIIISGNRKTNPNIILRELSFQIDEAYSLSMIGQKFRKARKYLMNMGLFTDVVVSLKSISGYDVYVNIEVTEKWYIWPQPFLKTVDKNFHQWWGDGHRDMNRINYGIRLVDNNFTGRNDKLKINIMNGYTRQVQVQYFGLYLDNKLRWSVNGGISVGSNREVNYMTRNDKPVPFKDDKFLRSYVSWFGEVNFRPAIKTTHTFGVGYNYEDLADTIFKLNPYFSPGHHIIKTPEFTYRLSYFDVDFIPYPTKGYIGELTLKKRGVNNPINLWQLTAKGSGTWTINPAYFFNLRAVGMIKLPFKQPYFTRQFIGYDDQFMQGYEYYVVDGVAGGYTKATLTRKLFTTRFSLGPARYKRVNNVPLRVFAKTFVNAGYVYSKYPGQNELTNSFLYSGGVGIDIVTFTDFVIKIEWSFNRLGENGLYLHQRNFF